MANESDKLMQWAEAHRETAPDLARMVVQYVESGMPKREVCGILDARMGIHPDGRLWGGLSPKQIEAVRVHVKEHGNLPPEYEKSLIDVTDKVSEEAEHAKRDRDA